MTSSAARLTYLALALLPAAHGAGLTQDAQDFASRQYNYIVVGGGTAGLAVAARLSEDPNRVVGVIEAGFHHPDDPLVNTPGLFGATQSQPTYDWMLKAVPQPGMNGQEPFMPRARALGGSSLMNYMAFDRASAAEYNDWYPFAGTSWKWPNLLQYFKKAENTMAPTVATPFNDPNVVAPAYQGTSGPIKKSYNSWYSDITKPYLDTLNALGIPTNTSPDGGDATGVYNCPMSVDRTTGKRSYSANTYMAQALSRSNFHVLMGAEVSKLNLHGRTVKSVTFMSGDTPFNVTVKNEVVLSAGSLKTPQILELSGFGNRALLNQLGIPVIRHLPGVGENLQDHIFLANSFELKPGFTTFDIMRNDPAFAASQQALYAQDGTGLLAATHSAFGFFDLSKFLTRPQIEAMFSELEQEIQSCELSNMDVATYKVMLDRFKRSVYPTAELIMVPAIFSHVAPKANTSYISILIANQHAWSRGSVHIKSKNPKDAPLIDPHYLERTFDAKVLAYGAKFARKIAQTQPLAQYIAGYHTPGADVDTDQEFMAYVRNFASSVYHPVGTASFGSETLGGVVSNRLIVHGTSNLRVADASVIPVHLATHIQSTVYAIAEQAADMIKADNVGQ